MSALEQALLEAAKEANVLENRVDYLEYKTLQQETKMKDFITKISAVCMEYINND